MKNKQLGFVFKKENCIQCHACESACKNWRMTKNGIRWRSIVHLWHGAYPDVSGQTLSISCMHCTKAECINVCPVQAIYKNEDNGIVLVDHDKCIGCKRCFNACPFKVPQFGSDGLMQKCDMCFGDPDVFETQTPPCVRMCPVQALEIKWMDKEEKIEHEQKLMEDLSILL